ncbi:hypothetical protein ACEWY4_027763 [Coilia grayii]|uniref:Uncharacterized protein n=1 Tax=Coilia grayii TaxID=363190 RepID=A0ABD1INI0_9TELE
MTTDDQFKALVRHMHNYLKATHHLRFVENSDGARPPVSLSRTTEHLERAILPAMPSYDTNLMLYGNARNWLCTGLQVLENHYLEIQRQSRQGILGLPLDRWEEAWTVAIKWGRRNIKQLHGTTIDTATDGIKRLIGGDTHLDQPQTTIATAPTTVKRDTDSDDDDGPLNTAITTNTTAPSPPLAMVSPNTGENGRPSQNQYQDITPPDFNPEVQTSPTREGNTNQSDPDVPIPRTPRIQVDAYPGAKITHATHILQHKTPTSPTTQKVILSFGINNREDTNLSNLETNIKTLVAKAQLAFPNARIYVPLLNFSNRLPLKMKKTIQFINSAIWRTGRSIPSLSVAHFRTVQDGIHWTGDTAEEMAQHWLFTLNK